ncbi:uncharacterized protein LOC132927283 isoform X1 [Rhopalosiphum padi]|uniref:uncharacterized protein LOC132927283 isoform X1 n=2 Tax=Rhopalosiphum padi TaxID=40932 RepID=UPI00298D8975|nr:uncharacterized protein LOC132927283 isoform X1 [Rhopalosiphum padi]
MFFYDSLLLLSNIVIVAVHTQSESRASPGISSCSYAGNLKAECGLEDVSIADIPHGCTAIIFDGIYMDLTNNVYVSCGGDDYLAKLDEILKDSKDVFVLYGHATQQEWTQVLACEACNNGTNSQNEMKGLKSFLDQHPGIKGLLITNLELDDNSVDFPEYSENFKVYLDTMRSNFPDLAIGLYLIGTFIVDQHTNPKSTWLNFTIIDSSVDFYSISVVTFNDCTDEFKLLGTAPIGLSNSLNTTSLGHSNSSSTNSTNSSSTGLTNLTMPDTNYTLSNLKDILADLSVPLNKIYYRYRLSPLSQDDSLSQCNDTVAEICSNGTDSSSWCYENLDSFNAKGQFSKENGAGFIVNYIELNDPENVCKCGPYPSFNAILDGYNGISANTSKECALLKRS